MNEMAGARAHELQQEASLTFVLRIYRCDGHRTDARGGEETRALQLSIGRGEQSAQRCCCTPVLECISS